MKVAVLFYGLVGSKVGKSGKGINLDPNEAGLFNKKNLIVPNKADVFIHTWSVESSEVIELCYLPVKSIYEEQRLFETERNIFSNRKLREYLKLMLSPLSAASTIRKWKSEAFRARSRWYSFRAVVDLMLEHENATGERYDAIFINRLDVGIFTEIDLTSFNLNKLWVSNWNHYPNVENDMLQDKSNLNTDFGFLDFWFFSNRDNIVKYSRLYDAIEKYHVSPHRASFEHAKSLNLDIGYTLYRWFDHEMIRRKFHDYKE